MRFDVYLVARGSGPPRDKPSRSRAQLAGAALWQAAEFVAARSAHRCAESVWAELRRLTAMDEIWGPATAAWPNDSVEFAIADARALRVYAIEEADCSFCGRQHRSAPADLCPRAREQYESAERWGDDLGLS
ncbi:MAG: hypothetical protein V7607_6721 [Solirubrobacteraceae bacterium]